MRPIGVDLVSFFRWHLKAFFMSALFLSSAGNTFGKDIIEIYFIPFDIETYVPVTPATIICTASSKWVLSDDVQALRLRTALTQQREMHSINKGRIRAKVIDGNHVYDIDSDGIAETGKSTYKIDKVEFEKIVGSASHVGINGLKCE